MPLPDTSGTPAASQLPAFWVSTEPQGESDAYVRFFTRDQGALAIKARGLLKPAARLSGVLKTADELLVSTAQGRGRAAVLTGAAVKTPHPAWRTNLHTLALAWLLLECSYVGSSTAQVNAAAYDELVTAFDTDPAGRLHALAAALCLRLLSLHGLLADLKHDAVSGEALPLSEPAFLLPSGEGLIGRATYNRSYARTGSGLVRLDAERRARWDQLQHEPLQLAALLPADAIDAALTTNELSRRIADAANHGIRSAEFLRRQWGLPRRAEIARAD